MKRDHDDAYYGIVLTLQLDEPENFFVQKTSCSCQDHFAFVFPSSTYFANTLALTSFPFKDRFNLWFGPILVQRR